MPDRTALQVRRRWRDLDALLIAYIADRWRRGRRGADAHLTGHLATLVADGRSALLALLLDEAVHRLDREITRRRRAERMSALRVGAVAVAGALLAMLLVTLTAGAAS